MNNTRWALVLAVLVVVLAGAYVALPAISRSAEQTAVRKTVTDFGSALEKVSLLSPKEELAARMDETYAAYVSSELLSMWKNDPAQALGRMTSSPWPDRIEVASVTKNDDGTYHVEGTVVEITSASSVPAATYPAHITVSKIGDAWLITKLEKGSYSELPQETTMQGIYGCAPLKEADGSKECIPGITRAQSDAHFVLDLSQIPQAIISTIRVGNTIEITGTLVPITMISSDQWQKYDIDGIIQAKELKKI